MDEPRWRTLMLASCLLLMGLAGCAGGGSAVDVAAPEWRSGYTWSYTTHYEEDGEWAENGTTESFNHTQDMRTVRQVLNTTIVFEGEPIYVLGGHQLWGEGGTSPVVEVVRQADLAPLPVHLAYTFTCELECVRTDASLQKWQEMPQGAYLSFPLRTGDTWHHVSDEHDGPAVAVAYKVAGGALVDTPLGRLEAARVDVQQTFLDQGWRDAIEAEAEAEGFDLRDLRLQFHQSSAIYYSDAYQAVVREDTEGRYLFAASGTGPDGRPFDFREEGTFLAQTILDGARLTTLPERPLEEALAILDGDVAIDDPSGQVVEVIDYTVGLVRDEVQTNAFGDARASFEARVDGEMPEGHDLLWTLTDAGGAHVADGSGPAFSFDPTEPGAYHVKVAAVLAGQEVAAATGRLVAHWVESTRLDCGPAGALTPACPRHAVPVHPGASALRVTVTPDGGVGELQSLSVFDAGGRTAATASRGGGAFVVRIDDLTEHEVGAAPWEAHFARGVSALQDLQLDVEVMYSDVPLGDAPAGMDPMPRLRDPMWPGPRLDHLPWA